MIPALQAIWIPPDPEERLKISLGKKKIIILDNHRDYRLGKVVFFSQIMSWYAMATVTQVRHTTVSGITKQELQDAGYSSPGTLLMALRKEHIDMAPESPVTVVRWDNVETG